MTHIPLASPVIFVLFNFLCQLSTAIDLRQRLSISKLPEDKLPMNVVVRTGESVVSLLVDAIGDVLEVSEENYERPPETIPEEVRKLVRGIYKLEGKLLLILDAEKAVNVSTSVADVS